MSEGRPKGDATQPSGIVVPAIVKTNADVTAEAGGQTVVPAGSQPPRTKGNIKKGAE